MATKKETKREIDKIQKAMDKLKNETDMKMAQFQKEMDIARTESRSKAVMNALVSNEIVKNDMVNEKYSNNTIEKALMRVFTMGTHADEMFHQFCEEECKKEVEIRQAKTARKSTAKPKTASKMNDKITSDINNTENALSKGSQGNAVPPQASNSPSGEMR